MPPPQQTPWDAQFTSAMQTPSMFARTNAPAMFSPLNVNTGLQGMEGAAVQMLLPSIMQGFMSQHKMMPSQFMPVQNFENQLRQQQYHQQQNIAMARASQRDKASIQNTIAGVMRMSTGQPLTREQQQQSYTMASDVQKFMPMLTMFLGPETVDSLMGSTGSATQMAQSIHRGLRMSRDPSSGGFGVSGKNAGTIASEVFNELYGTREKTRQMGGITAGMSGQMFEELTARGLVPSSSAYIPMEKRLANISRRTFDEGQERRMAESMLSSRGMPITEDSIAGARQELRTTQQNIRKAVESGNKLDLSALTNMPGADEMLSASDATRIAGKLKNMAGAVNAMRDIFGDAGRPNAPMSEIINGLEALTQGGLANMSPGRLEQTVRTTKNLAESSGLGVQGMMGLTAQAANYGDQLGLDRSMAVQNAQNTAAFASAFRDNTRGDLPAFGALNPEQAALLNTQLTANAQASTVGNIMNSLIRMQEEGLIDPNSEAAVAAEALKAGSTTYTYKGETKEVPPTQSSFNALMKRSDIDQNFATSILNDRYQNQEYGRNFNTGLMARERQAQIDLVPRIGNTFSGALGTRMGTESMDVMRRRGVIRDGVDGQGDYRRLTQGISKDMAQRFMELADTPEVYKDPKKLNEAMKNITRQSIERRVKAAGGTDDDVAAVIESMGGEQGMLETGVMAMSNLDRRIQYDPLMQGYKSRTGLLQMSGKQTMQSARSRIAEAGTQAEMQSAMAKFGRSSPMSRAVDAIQEAPAGEDVGKILSKVFGGVETEELAREKPFSGFKDAMEMFNNAERFKATSATQSEIDAKYATNKGLTMDELRESLRKDPNLRDTDKADFDQAREQVERRNKSRVGALTTRGQGDRRLAASIVEGLTEGGASSVDAMDDIADELQDLPGLQRFKDKMDDPKAREARRASIVAALDAALERPDITSATKEHYERLRNATQGLIEARKGNTIMDMHKRLGIATGQTVTPGDVAGALEMAKSAASQEDMETAVASQGSFLKEGKAITEAMLSNATDMQQLGAGGTDLVRKQYDTENQISAVAKKLGISAAQLMAGDLPEGTSADIASQAKGLRSAYVAGLSSIEQLKRTNRMPGYGDSKHVLPMGRHEIELARNMADFVTGKALEGGPEQQLEHVVRRLVESTSAEAQDRVGGASKMQDIVRSQIAKGDRVLPLARALMARDEMVEMANEQGLMGITGEGSERKIVFGEAAKEAQRLTPEELQRMGGAAKEKAIESLKSRRGSLDEAAQIELQSIERQSSALDGIGHSKMQLGELTKKLEQFSTVDRTRLQSSAANDVAPKKMQLTGKVRIENNEMLSVNGQVSTGDLEHNDMPNNMLSQVSQSFT